MLIYMYQTVELMAKANPQHVLELFKNQELTETESGLQYFIIKTDEASKN